MAADGGAGSSGRRYQATVEIEWADEQYPLECIKDSCGRVTVALKELRNIVCRSQAHPQPQQLNKGRQSLLRADCRDRQPVPRVWEDHGR